MVPKVGDKVKFTNKFIEKHRKNYFHIDNQWLEQYIDLTLLISKVDHETKYGIQNIEFYIASNPDIKGAMLIDLESGKFSDITWWPVVFEYVLDSDSKTNSSIYCVCGNTPFTVTGFTSLYKVCTVCHEEKRD